MVSMIIDKDEAVLVLDGPVNKKEATGIIKEIPDNTTKVNIQGDLDNILGLLLALDQERYFINVDGKIPFDELFKGYDGVAFFPAWMELAHTYTDHTSTPASVFDLQNILNNGITYDKWLKKDL